MPNQIDQCICARISRRRFQERMKGRGRSWFESQRQLPLEMHVAIDEILQPSWHIFVSEIKRCRTLKSAGCRESKAVPFSARIASTSVRR